MKADLTGGKAFPIVTVGGACAAIRIIDKELREKREELSMRVGWERPLMMYSRRDAEGNIIQGKWERPGDTPEQTGSPAVRAQIAELEEERALWRVYLRACADNLPTTKQGGAV